MGGQFMCMGMEHLFNFKEVRVVSVSVSIISTFRPRSMVDFLNTQNEDIISNRFRNQDTILRIILFLSYSTYRSSPISHKSGKE